MSERAKQLSEDFVRAHSEFVAAMAVLTDEQWLTYCSQEQRTVAALAHHVAWGCAVEVNAFRAMVLGQPLPVWSRDTLAEANARDAQEFAECDREETLALLEAEGNAALAFVESLTDEQLARRGKYDQGLPEWSVDEWVANVLIWHTTVHLASIRHTLGLATPS